MSKPAPLQPHTIYHIYNRGNNGETIFRTPENYRYFLTLYTKHFHPYAQTYAYCLLPNHFHFLVYILPTPNVPTTPRVLKTLGVSPTPPPTPSQAFSNLCNAYAKAFNKANGRSGSLLQHPFGRIPVTTDAYFYNLITYIHRNPQKHGLTDDFRAWPYTSYDAILHDKPTRVHKTAVLEWYGGPGPFQQAHQTDPNETRLKKYIQNQE